MDRYWYFWKKFCWESKQSKCLIFSPHLTSASAPPGKTGIRAIASFSIIGICCFSNRRLKNIHIFRLSLDHSSTSLQFTKQSTRLYTPKQDLERGHSSAGKSVETLSGLGPDGYCFGQICSFKTSDDCWDAHWWLISVTGGWCTLMCSVLSLRLVFSNNCFAPVSLAVHKHNRYVETHFRCRGIVTADHNVCAADFTKRLSLSLQGKVILKIGKHLLKLGVSVQHLFDSFP